MSEQLFTVRSTDGEPKAWRHDSVLYELAPGEEKILPEGPAQQAVAYYTVRLEGGDVAEPTVSIEPFEGTVTLGPPVVQDPETGEKFGSIEALIASVKARVAAGASGEQSEPEGEPGAAAEQQKPGGEKKPAKSAGA
jgi:hypothetical protein